MRKKIKVLNLYAGIGGNRKLWKDVEVTAVENNKEIAKIYQKHFPKDRVIIGDAVEYLLKHYREFDFIWASPPCPTHSRMRFLKEIQENSKSKLPDMTLYGLIIFLKHFFKGKYCVENVMSYYEPLIKPQVSNNHFFWCNFGITNSKKDIRDIRQRKGINYKEKRNAFDLEGLSITKSLKHKVLNNCVKPEVGLNIFNSAFKEKQTILYEKKEANSEKRSDK